MIFFFFLFTSISAIREARLQRHGAGNLLSRCRMMSVFTAHFMLSLFSNNHFSFSIWRTKSPSSMGFWNMKVKKMWKRMAPWVCVNPLHVKFMLPSPVSYNLYQRLFVTQLFMCQSKTNYLLLYWTRILCILFGICFLAHLLTLLSLSSRLCDSFEQLSYFQDWAWWDLQSGRQSRRRTLTTVKGEGVSGVILITSN